uniref:Uncharacterized protein n=1 Tax=Glossina brevipalpis TaxID=37001 RepID=A0A1A9W9V1_9MUSC
MKKTKNSQIQNVPMAGVIFTTTTMIKQTSETQECGLIKTNEYCLQTLKYTEDTKRKLLIVRVIILHTDVDGSGDDDVANKIVSEVRFKSSLVSQHLLFYLKFYLTMIKFSVNVADFLVQH